MRGQKRPTTERARAVGIAVMTGNPSEAARQTGIPERTIREWLDRPEFAELRQRNKEVVAEEWWAGIQEVARSLLRDAPNAPFKDRAVAFGILFDKLQLTRGEATVRSETRTLADYPDHEQDLLHDLIADELARRADAETAGTVERTAVEETGPR